MLNKQNIILIIGILIISISILFILQNIRSQQNIINENKQLKLTNKLIMQTNKQLHNEISRYNKKAKQIRDSINKINHDIKSIDLYSNVSQLSNFSLK